MSDDERAFYRIAKDRGESLARAQEVIENMARELDGVRTALKGFTDVLNKYDVTTTDELDTILCAWKQGIWDGSEVWIIQEAEDPGKFRMVRSKYEMLAMAHQVGDRVFTSPDAAAARLRELTVLNCGGRA